MGRGLRKPKLFKNVVLILAEAGLANMVHCVALSEDLCMTVGTIVKVVEAERAVGERLHSSCRYIN